MNSNDRAGGRRAFLAAAGAGLAWGIGGGVSGGSGAAAAADKADSYSAELFNRLSPEQRRALCFPVGHPLRAKVSANWAVTPGKIADLAAPVQELAQRVFDGALSEAGRGMFAKQMKDDHGGIGNYHFAFFGKPGDDRFEFLLTGRHVTLRVDGKPDRGAAFGGTMVYGHDASGATEKPGHPGNVFWYQGVRADALFKALDGGQRAKALLGKAPSESSIRHRAAGYQGLPLADLKADQQALARQVMADLLQPYRKEDADEALRILEANGGLAKLHLAYYRQTEGGQDADLGGDGVWDIWRLEGPGFVWHFRGFPHVHTWVHIAPAKPEAPAAKPA